MGKNKRLILTYCWETPIPHQDNIETMNDFLENHLDKINGLDIEIKEVDGTLVFASDTESDVIKYEIHASGDGDFSHHKVEIYERDLYNSPMKNVFKLY